MQQLSLEQLEVESYAVQPSEMELTDLKGGSTPACYAAGAAIVVGAMALYGALASRPQQTVEYEISPQGDTTTTVTNYYY